MSAATASSSAWLRLDLRGDHAPGVRAHVELDGGGASIGRGASCDWQLDAAGVSRLHASVRQLDGVYFIEDHSTNGVLHNGTPLRPGHPAVLRDGDLVQIDLFEIGVSVQTQADEITGGATAPVPAVAAVPAPEHAGPATRADGFATDDDAFSALDAPGIDVADAVDPLALFATSYTMAGAAAPQASPDWNHAPALSDRYRAPGSTPASTEPLLPEHWDSTRSEFLPRPRRPAAIESSVLDMMEADAPPPASPPAVDATGPIETRSAEAVAPAPVAAAAPVPTPATPAPAPVPTASPASNSPASSSDAHALLTALVAGLMDVLRARAELKNSLRLPATLIRRTENNPLKFAPTADEAVARLLGPPDPAYLDGTAAIDDALRDIGQHQLALMAGMRAAFEHAFAHFDPARFEGEAATPGALPGWGGRPWKRYAQYYRDLRDDPGERFRRLFGDEFARAYEEQMTRARIAATPPSRNRT